MRRNETGWNGMRRQKNEMGWNGMGRQKMKRDGTGWDGKHSEMNSQNHATTKLGTGEINEMKTERIN